MKLNFMQSGRPLTCVADGTGRILESEDLMMKVSSTISDKSSF